MICCRAEKLTAAVRKTLQDFFPERYTLPSRVAFETMREKMLRSTFYQLLAITFAVTCFSSSRLFAQTVVLGEDKTLTGGIPGKGPLRMNQIKKFLADDANHEVLDFQLPKGIDAAKANIFIPEDNPITRAKIELGRQLYFDTRLSSDNTIACASCHHPDKGFGFDSQFGIGVDGQQGDRNSPVAYNRIISKEQFWDGRAESLEAQAVGPIANPIEMGNTHQACVETLKKIPGYRIQFQKIFGNNGINIDNVGKAIATFERAIVTAPAPYDYYSPVEQFEKLFADDLDDLDDDLQEQYEELKAQAKEHPMSESAVRGMKLFATKANCAVCHAGANFTDEQYHNLGVGMEGDDPDLGRFVVTKEEKDKGGFKTPTLRNVALTAPYMHDGSQQTLEEVVEWYNKGGHPNKWLSDKMKPLNLNDQEKKDLVAFMKEGLTSDFPEINSGRLPMEAPKKKNAGDAKKGDAKKVDAAKMKQDAPAKVAQVAKPATSAAKPAETATAGRGKGFLGVKCDGRVTGTVARISGVHPGGAAEAAGLQIGDEIIQVGDHRIANFNELVKAMANMKSGQELEVKIRRGNETITSKVKLGASSK